MDNDCMGGRVDPCDCGTLWSDHILLTPSPIVVDVDECPDCSGLLEFSPTWDKRLKYDGGTSCRWAGPTVSQFPSCISADVVLESRECNCCTWIYSIYGPGLCLIWEGRMINTANTPCGIYLRTDGCSATASVTITCGSPDEDDSFCICPVANHNDVVVEKPTFSDDDCADFSIYVPAENITNFNAWDGTLPFDEGVFTGGFSFNDGIFYRVPIWAVSFGDPEINLAIRVFLFFFPAGGSVEGACEWQLLFLAQSFPHFPEPQTPYSRISDGRGGGVFWWGSKVATVFPDSPAGVYVKQLGCSPEPTITVS